MHSSDDQWSCDQMSGVLYWSLSLGSSPSGISDILHNVISCAWRDNFEIPAGRSRRCFCGWKFPPPFQRCWLGRKRASKLKKRPKIEYMFSSCILNLNKKEYTTFFQKISTWLRRRCVWVRAEIVVPLQKMASVFKKQPNWIHIFILYLNSK